MDILPLELKSFASEMKIKNNLGCYFFVLLWQLVKEINTYLLLLNLEFKKYITHDIWGQ